MAEKVWSEAKVNSTMLVFALLCGVMTCVMMTTQGCHFERTAIRHGAAQYNAKTGEFEWKSVENMGNSP